MDGEKVLVALSGGVDSAVAALLLSRAGYSCAGGIMRMTDDPDYASKRDAAADVCRRLGMGELLEFDVWGMFFEKVVKPFARSYSEGKTPNPCVECNRHLKFGEFLRRARTLGFDKIATGHYAVREDVNGTCLLKKAADRSRDQSYFLYRLGQDELASVLFPLGGMTKSAVRSLARENNFASADSPDSQDICFVRDGDYRGIVSSVVGDLPPGVFKDMSGKVICANSGIHNYTVGQRRGLGIAGGTPLYAVRILKEENAVYVGERSLLYSSEFAVSDVSWVSGAVCANRRLGVRTRYCQNEVPAEVSVADNGATARIRLSEPLFAVTPGQSAVFYDGDVVVGGGIIVSSSPT